MRKSFVTGSAIAVVAYVVSRKMKNDALLRCFADKQFEVEDADYTSINGEDDENTVVYEDSSRLPPSKSKTLKFKTDNSLITLNLEWNFSL